MTSKPVNTETAEQIRARAEQDYELEIPKPTPPTPPDAGRPRVIGIDKAHAWIDVTVTNEYYRSPAEPRAKFFIVHRNGEKDQRIEGTLTPDGLDAFIEELTGVRDAIKSQAVFLAATEEYKKANELWESAKGEHARKAVADWERAKKAAAQPKE